MDQLGKIRRHHWKERLDISNNAKFESDTSQASEDIASQSCHNKKVCFSVPRVKRIMQLITAQNFFAKICFLDSI